LYSLDYPIKRPRVRSCLDGREANGALAWNVRTEIDLDFAKFELRIGCRYSGLGDESIQILSRSVRPEPFDELLEPGAGGWLLNGWTPRLDLQPAFEQNFPDCR
jgi:hypothetical protein